MKAEICFCNNIEHAVIEIVPNCLNIKYAANGTGKSTIAKAIKAFVEGNKERMEHMIPFKYQERVEGHFPSVKGTESIKRVYIFDEEYLNSFVFTPDAIVPKTFEVFVKTEAYDRQMKQIENHLSQIRSIFLTSNEIEDLRGVLSSFRDAFGNVTKGYSKASQFAKGLSKGNTVANIPEGLDAFASFIRKENRNHWLKWHKQGDDLIVKEEHKCPYCAHIMSEQEERLLDLLAEKYDAKAVEHLINTVSIFKSLAHEGLSAGAATFVNQIVEKANEISSEEVDRLLRIKGQAVSLLGRLDELRRFDFYGITSMPDRAKKIADELSRLHLDANEFPELMTVNTQRMIDSVNRAIDETLKSVQQLQLEIDAQRSLIVDTISGNEKAINEFMQLAGYPYYVSIDDVGGGSFRTRLHHKDQPNGEVPDPQACLSYGERNAFALAMFVYDVVQDDPTDALIILDDPISSFDGNKKFALLNLMFLNDGGKTLKGRTAMMLTHDFCPVIDAMRNLKSLFDHSLKAWYLYCSNGLITEKAIRGEHILEAVRLNKKNMENETIDNLIRIVYFRRWKEFRGETEDSVSYHISSSLLHLRPAPTYDDGSLISDEDVKRGLEEIQMYIHGFDYAQTLRNGLDKTYLKTIYENSTSNYEKLLVFRYMEKNGWLGELPGIVRKFMNEPFHIENDYVCQLNPRRYEIVPDLQIKLFDKIVSQKLK